MLKVFGWAALLIVTAFLGCIEVSCRKHALERIAGKPVSWRDTFILGR